jgi:transcriptional regulator with PAS, ATPase and Fis domain
MSIHILTTDSKVIEQLGQLLEGGQQPFHFHDDLEELIDVIQRLKKTDKVFYDLALESSLMAFDALRFGSRKTNLVAFEMLEDGVKTSRCPKKAKHYFVLSKDQRKSGVRLKNILHEVDALAVKKKTARKKAVKKAAAKKTNVQKAEAPPITLSRYLTAKSHAMQRVLVKIAELAKDPKFVFITGEDGADFELTARELNFRTNGDQSPLHIADPMRVEIDEIKHASHDKDTTSYCYLGLSYELGALTVARLNDYLSQLSETAIKQPSPCFILGHVEDSEVYLEAEVKGLIKTFVKLGTSIELPSMAERKEDVSLITQSIFTTLRTAHPFLMTRTLSRDAIELLESQCAEMNYSSIVRVIRNSMALTQRDTLTQEEIMNFRDDSPTAQHLIESLADEKFFKDQTGAA